MLVRCGHLDPRTWQLTRVLLLARRETNCLCMHGLFRQGDNQVVPWLIIIRSALVFFVMMVFMEGERVSQSETLNNSCALEW